MWPKQYCIIYDLNILQLMLSKVHTFNPSVVSTAWTNRRNYRMVLVTFVIIEWQILSSKNHWNIIKGTRGVPHGVWTHLLSFMISPFMPMKNLLGRFSLFFAHKTVQFLKPYFDGKTKEKNANVSKHHAGPPGPLKIPFWPPMHVMHVITSTNSNIIQCSQKVSWRPSKCK